MIPALRHDFNTRFRPETFRTLLHSLDAIARTHVAFPVAETPCFFPASMLDEMSRIGIDLTLQLVNDPDYLARSLAAIPEAWRAADQNAHPHFLTADFGLVREHSGRLAPRLVEMQAFPSVFGFQWAVSEAYRSAFSLDPSLRYLLGGLDESQFWKLLARTIVAGHDPETVVLIDVDPANQKTLPDFHITADRLGIRIVDIAALEVLDPSRDSPTQLDRVSATAITAASFPFAASTIAPSSTSSSAGKSPSSSTTASPSTLNGPAIPTGISTSASSPSPSSTIPPFRPPSSSTTGSESSAPASKSARGPKESPRDRLPADRDRLILKPLYSFAGQGILFAPTDDQLAAIPPAQHPQLFAPGTGYLRTRY